MGVIFLNALLSVTSAIAADETSSQTQQRVTIDASGTVHIPALAIPFSPLASDQAKQYLIGIGKASDSQSPKSSEDFPRYRREFDVGFVTQVQSLRSQFAVAIKSETIGGIRTEIIEPTAGVSNKSRVLINVHGGGFVVGTLEGQGRAESIPIAALGRIKVVTVDYRLAPEHTFPAASEDVAAVYKELLKTYRPENIGIYGCSAGGMLTAQAVAWFQVHHLPRPGAVGVLCAGAIATEDGDSAYTGTLLFGQQIPERAVNPYIGSTDIRNPLLSPGYYPNMLAKFPPTLIITSTRDQLMSGAVYTHTQLVKAGVQAELYVWEGMTHGFISANTNAPEAREAWDVVVKFFENYLGRK